MKNRPETWPEIGSRLHQNSASTLGAIGPREPSRRSENGVGVASIRVLLKVVSFDTHSLLAGPDGLSVVHNVCRRAS